MEIVLIVMIAGGGALSTSALLNRGTPYGFGAGLMLMVLGGGLLCLVSILDGITP